MNRRTMLFLLLTSLIYNSLSAKEINHFSGNSEEFIRELGSYMKDSKNPKVVAIYERFEQKFKSGAFVESQINTIIETSNRMLDMDLKPSPYFRDYLKSLTLIQKKWTDDKQFDQWHVVLHQMLSKRDKKQLKNFKVFLGFTPNFFQHMAFQYGRSKTVWKAQVAKYQFTYENDLPCVRFDQLHLVAKVKTDSILIENTTGVYCPVTKAWKGNGGRIDWARSEMKHVYCELNEYQLELKKGWFEIDQVDFYHPHLFPDGAIKGKVVNKITTNNKKISKSYPRFESDDKKLEIKNIGKNMNYIGGFRLYGKTLYGYGDTDEKATIELFDDKNQLAFRGRATDFKIQRGDNISGEQVEAVLFFGKDSIYHPSVNLVYEILSKDLNLKKGNRGSDQSPFYDSYHQVNIDTEKLSWTLGTDSIAINQKNAKFGNGNERVSFESLHYFDTQSFRKFQNVADVNPISSLKLLVEKEKSRSFSADKFAKALNPRFDVSSIKSLLYDLLSEGFIHYDAHYEMLTVREKLLHFADASQNKVDYDLIKYISKSEETNAYLDLRNNDIVVKDMSIVEFSDRQKVAGLPFQGNVILKENRNTAFDGKLYAGFSAFEGKDFNFEYKKNYLVLDSIRFFDLFVPSGNKDQNGEEEAVSIASRIEHLDGVLLIDAPDNKSGREDIEQFPSFNSKGAAYVFYDSKETQNATYQRDSFYFQLDKFSFNSLDKFTADDVHFKGQLYSAGIFPDFKETLVLQEDYSLGFSTKSPEEGFPTYQNKGKFIGQVNLSNEGFLGEGQVNYKWATIDSEDITFKPNQLLTSAKQFNITEDRSGEIQVPEVSGQEIFVDWQPYKDSMYIRAEKEPFKLFKKGNYTLKDMLILTPDGLKGRGEFDWAKGKMQSNLYSLGAHSISSDTTQLFIRATGIDELALDTRNVAAHLDFDNHIGSVKANSDSVSTVLPYNTYITSLNEFDWDMKNETITFKADKDGKGSFLSFNPDQDSLRFWGKTAFYDLKTHDLKLGGVVMVEAADAFVYPEEGTLEVAAGGKMKTINNARIIANRSNKYHIINRATVDILSRNEYRAKGFYEYNVGDRVQEFELNNIIGTRVGKGRKKKRKILTKASGEVTVADEFYIDRKNKCQGDISLRADSSALQFKGFAFLDAPKMPGRQWFFVKSQGDKNDLKISYQKTKNKSGQPIQTGLFLNKITGELYPSVMMSLKQRKDRKVFGATGLFKLDAASDEFVFGDSLKIVSSVKYGNLLNYSNANGNLKVEGKFDIGSGLKYGQLKVAGEATTIFSTEATEVKPLSIDALVGWEIDIPEKLLKMIFNDIMANAYDARNINYLVRGDFYSKVLSEFIPAGKDYSNTRAKMLNYGLELPKKHDPFAFVFGEMQLTWDEELQSFISHKEKAGLVSLGGEPVNKMLETYVQCRMPYDENDRLTLYVKSPSGSFFYFEYQDGALTTVSDNVEYNDLVENLKKKERSKKMDDGEFFEIQLADYSRANIFLNRIKNRD